MDHVSATVNILGRQYKLKIAASDEECLRKAADIINNQARLYGQNFAYKDHQDLLSMVALTQITQLAKLQEGAKFKETELEDRLNTINNLLEEQLDPDKRGGSPTII